MAAVQLSQVEHTLSQSQKRKADEHLSDVEHKITKTTEEDDDDDDLFENDSPEGIERRKDFQSLVFDKAYLTSILEYQEEYPKYVETVYDTWKSSPNLREAIKRTLENDCRKCIEHAHKIFQSWFDGQWAPKEFESATWI